MRRKHRQAQRFRTRMFLMSSVPVLVIMTLSFFLLCLLFTNNLLQERRNALHQLLEKSAFDIEKRMEGLEDSMRKMLVDQELFRLVQQGEPVDEYNKYLFILEMKSLLNHYMTGDDIVDSVIVMPDYAITQKSLVYQPLSRVLNSDLVHGADALNGQVSYHGLFSYAEMFHFDADIYRPYSQFIAAAKKLNVIRLNHGYGVNYLPATVSRPILCVYFDPSAWLHTFDILLSQDDIHMVILQKDDTVFLKSQEELPFDIASLAEAAQVAETGKLTRLAGFELIACPLGSLGTAIAYFPTSVLIGYMKPFLLVMILMLAVFILIQLVVVNVATRSVIKPLRDLTLSVESMAAGSHPVPLREEGVYELQILSRKYNELNASIDDLIQRDVAARVREHDLTVRMLQVQFEPHFLYNTLNTVNWIAINEGSEDISGITVRLANMLRYTLRHSRPLNRLKDDMEWIWNYIWIQEKRLGDSVSFSIKIQPEMDDVLVPLLFMQPLLENALQHGLKDVENGGQVRVTGDLEDGICHFTVTDNGVGINPEAIALVMRGNGNHIGISNVNMRIRLLYGEPWGLTIEPIAQGGTKVDIRFPARYGEDFSRQQ